MAGQMPAGQVEYALFKPEEWPPRQVDQQMTKAKPVLQDQPPGNEGYLAAVTVILTELFAVV